ncbi:MAG TPA: ribosome maturation factor RimP [Trueperaceae bacterium]|nr:ribosome maturation factor RimP [Trueperaceae bacterium]
MDLKQAATEVLTPLGYEVLELSVSSSGRSRKVLLRIDRLDEAPVTMDDVERASEVFGLEMDRLDPFDEPYELEVESPGSQRPLVTARHFERFHDLLVKFRAGGESLTGRVLRVEDGAVTFLVRGEERTFPVADIEQARLAEWPDKPR